MKLTKFSEQKLQKTFDMWEVDDEYAKPMINYFVHGLEPGSFFTSLMANDLIGTMTHSHMANSIPALKRLVAWLQFEMPAEAWGSYRAVSQWLKKSEDDRRKILEDHCLILTAEQETWETLKD